MDVIVSNQHKDELYNLDADIIKSVSGVYAALEIVEMFTNFYYDHLIIDATALRDNEDASNFEALAKGLDPDKLIFLLPEGSKLCTPSFLSKLISYGIYNFTTSLNGISFLLKKPNTYKDVEHIAKMAEVHSNGLNDGVSDEKSETPKPSSEKAQTTVPVTVTTTTPVVKNKPIIIGIRNVTASAGATTLIFMMMKELSLVYGHENVLAIEIDKNDFSYFYDKKLISIKQVDLRNTLDKYSNLKIILVDLNGCREDTFCNDIIYLVEPSTLKLNRLVQRNRVIFQNLSGRKVVLNQSILQSNDVFDFENEAGIKIFYNIPPLDERKRNSVVADFLSKLGLINVNSGDSSGKIFGLFRR